MPIFTLETNYFGLDIGTRNLRMTELRKSGLKPSLITYGALEIPFGLSQSDSDTDKEQLANHIKDLVKRTGTKTKNVACALSGTDIFTATIKLPFMDSKELKSAIPYQVEQHIPLAMTEIKYDYNVVRPGAPSGEMVVMIIAAPITKINRLLEITDKSGLNVVAIEPSMVAFCRALNPGMAEPIVLINIGSLSTELAIVEASNIILVRNINVGGDAFSRAISQNLGVDIKQAEQFKIKFGLDEKKLEGALVLAVKPILSEILEEVKRSIKFYSSEFKGIAPKKIIIGGGGAKLYKLPEYLANSLKLPVSFGNAWGKVSFPSKETENLSVSSLDFGVATGLAMREMVE